MHFVILFCRILYIELLDTLHSFTYIMNFLNSAFDSLFSALKGSNSDTKDADVIEISSSSSNSSIVADDDNNNQPNRKRSHSVISISSSDASTIGEEDNAIISPRDDTSETFDKTPGREERARQETVQHPTPRQSLLSNIATKRAQREKKRKVAPPKRPIFRKLSIQSYRRDLLSQHRKESNYEGRKRFKRRRQSTNFVIINRLPTTIPRLSIPFNIDDLWIEYGMRTYQRLKLASLHTNYPSPALSPHSRIVKRLPVILKRNV